MTVASFIASQRASYDVPHVISCRALRISESWFYKWRDREPSERDIRRAELDKSVEEIFSDSGGNPRTYGSPRIHAELLDAGWKVSEKTVAQSMTRQGLVARPKRRFRSLTRPDKAADPIPDLVNRQFTAEKTDEKWCGDLTEIPTDEGKLYLAIVIDLAARRIPGFAIGEHHDAELAAGALKMAAAVRGGDVDGVIFHSDKGSEYTAWLFEQVCERLGIKQSMGRVGSCFDNAVSESWNSTLEFELLSRQRFATKADARKAVARFIDTYNTTRRHSRCEMLSPIAYEALLAERAQVAEGEADAA
jgi:putative transposase